MSENEFAAAIRAKPEYSVKRAAISSYDASGLGLAAGLLVLDYQVVGNYHQRVETNIQERLLSYRRGALPEPHFLSSVYEELTQKALAAGADELHIAFPHGMFSAEELDSKKVRERLATGNVVKVFVYQN